jgi:hypothetical protein
MQDPLLKALQDRGIEQNPRHQNKTNKSFVGSAGTKNPASVSDFQTGEFTGFSDRNDSCARIGTLAMSAPENEVSGANALASSQLRVKVVCHP